MAFFTKIFRACFGEKQEPTSITTISDAQRERLEANALEALKEMRKLWDWEARTNPKAELKPINAYPKPLKFMIRAALDKIEKLEQ